ncbi:hypothetical protein HYPSUDRAFT_215794 [Hypholoma sublateritium FD-334 SS-4]|uniref:Uncharacterized protein n=1 Tax=Hypholoma sublateritium (strain FD-334 SS-4) TaxID=945553 RepID=A0A0D2P114_HYPSF|nr:hypothetical protein HYPSUDRAFT_215794 [Hypholoma sublateritium FD-334 SS-4]
MMVLPSTPFPCYIFAHLQQRLNDAPAESSQALNHSRLEFLEKELAVHRQLHSTYLSVIQENVELHREIREASARSRCRPAWPTDRPPFSGDPLPMKISRAPSLSPSDSISQTGDNSSSPSCSTQSSPLTSLVEQPYLRPEQYPPTVLWNSKDCLSEPSLSHGSMEKCIRNADGTRIHKREWRAIMATAGAIIDKQLRPLTAPKAGLAPRTFYRKHFARVWLSAIATLEVEQPILTLCAGHWKAEHALGQILDNKRSGDARRELRECKGDKWTHRVSAPHVSPPVEM